MMNNIEFKLDVSNRNLDYFEPEALKSAIEKYKLDFIDKERSIGTMHVPGDIFNGSFIPLENSSHVVEKLELNDNGDVVGILRVLETPMGNKLKDILNAKLTPEYSMAYRVKDSKITEIVQIAVVGIKD